MAQAAFEFSPLADAASHGLPGRTGQPTPAPDGSHGAAQRDPIGLAIGHDHARHRLTPPLRHLHDHNPVRQGWDRGRALFGSRTLRPTAAVRQWLALRLQAWQHGQAFEDVLVTPHFLARIDAHSCPVGRDTLTLWAGHASDATVIRLNPDAAYAAGNLAVVSQQVADAAGGHGAAALLALAQRADADPAAAPAGLDAAACLRLAVLASFATPLPHAQAALLPLCVLPPNRVRVINPVQALQLMLSLQFSQAGYARRLLGLAALVPGSEARQAFQIFMHTLLARRLAVGPAADAPTLRRALEDSWSDPLVNRRWQRLATRLTAAQCEQLLQRAHQRGWVVGGGHWLAAEEATDGWAMPADAGSGRRDQAIAVAVPVPATARPGKARSLGSQKLAS